MKQKKAQVAVETLLIYGIAILIVMLAIGALISFGVLDLGGLLPDQCQFAGELSCENFRVTNSEVQLELMNNFGKNIQSMVINITGEGNNKGLWNCPVITYADTLVQGSITDPPVQVTGCDISVPSGKKIQGSVFVTVNIAGSQIPRVIKGNIRATVS